MVASNGGDGPRPAWYHNLGQSEGRDQRRPEAFRRDRTCRCCPDDPDYARLWQIVNKSNGDRYNAYQAKTTRPIPVIRLTP